MGSLPFVGGVHVAHINSLLYSVVFLCFVRLRPVPCGPVLPVSVDLPFLIAPTLGQCCQCLWIYLSWLPPTLGQCCQCLWIYLSWLPPPSVNVASVSGFTFLDWPPPSVSSNVYFSNFSLFVRIQVYSALQCDRQLHLSKSLGHAPIKVCHTE